MASPVPTPTRSPPPLSAAAHALHKRAHANFHAWVKTNPRVGQRSLCALGVDDLAPSERRALMDTLVAGGYDVREVAYDGDRTPGTAFLVERTMLAALPVTTEAISDPVDPPLSPAARVVFDMLHARFHEWIDRMKRSDRLFAHEFSVDDLSLEERLALMNSLKAAGFAVRELAYDTCVPRNAFYVECAVPSFKREEKGEDTPMGVSLTAFTEDAEGETSVPKTEGGVAAAAAPSSSTAAPPVDLDAMVQQVQASFRAWMHTEPRSGQAFKHDLAVDGLTRSERDVLMTKLVADGFAAWEFSNDANPTLSIQCAVPSFGDVGEDVTMAAPSLAGETPAPKTEVGAAVVASSSAATQLDDQARASAIVDEANRQFTQWLILTNCSPTSSFAMSVDLMGMPDSSRQLVKRLLHASEFRMVERGHDALHIHRPTSRSAV